MQENLKQVLAHYETTKKARNEVIDKVETAKKAAEANKTASYNEVVNPSIVVTEMLEFEPLVKNSDEIVIIEAFNAPATNSSAKATKARQTNAKVEEQKAEKQDVQTTDEESITIKDEATPLAGIKSEVENDTVVGSKNNASNNGITKLLFSTQSWMGWLIVLVLAIGGGAFYTKKKISSEKSDK